MLRAFLCVALLLVVGLVDKVWITAVEPSVEADIYLRQVEDPSYEHDTARRAWRSTNFAPYGYGSVVVLALILYSKELKTVYKENSK